jgi:FtsH-binding integral membrane protein
MENQNSITEETNRFIQRVYLWMFLGLVISGITAYVVSSNSSLYSLFLFNGLIFVSLIILELVLVLCLVWLVKKMSASLAILMFLLYSFVTGLTLSVIFLVYTLGSIMQVFFIASLMFLVMSIYGRTTKKDLTSLGGIMIMSLFGIIIAGIVNLFLRSSTVDYLISFIGVIVFSLLTAYDTQKIKERNIIGNEGTSEDTKESIMGALTLYLDFINLFLDILKILGKKK